MELNALFFPSTFKQILQFIVLFRLVFCSRWAFFHLFSIVASSFFPFCCTTIPYSKPKHCDWAPIFFLSNFFQLFFPTRREKHKNNHTERREKKKKNECKATKNLIFLNAIKVCIFSVWLFSHALAVFARFETWCRAIALRNKSQTVCGFREVCSRCSLTFFPDTTFFLLVLLFVLCTQISRYTSIGIGTEFVCPGCFYTHNETKCARC